MKLIVDLEKKTLRILENERSIFRGEYGADKLELYINKTLENEYPTITALLSNGRKIGPYSTDSAYSSETIDGVAYTVASFTLSKENGFTLSEGKMQITIWMNSNGKKEAIGNVLLNVINTTAFDDGDIIISGDVEGTLVNYKVELENLGNQVNTFNGRLNNVETNKVDRSELNATNNRVTAVETNKLDKILTKNCLYTTDEIMKIVPFNYLAQGMSIPIRNYYGQIAVPEVPTENEHATSKKYVDDNIKSVSDRIANVETNKLDKTTTSNILYGTDNLGNQTNFELDNGAMISGTIPKRDTNGQLVVPLSPSGNKHATSRHYVDSKITESKNYTDTKIADLINGAPKTLDTLKEIADAFAENKSVVEALNDAIGNKVDKDIILEIEDEKEPIYISNNSVPTTKTVDVMIKRAEATLNNKINNLDKGVDEAEVKRIVKTMTITSEEAFDPDDNTIPTTKTVANMISESGGGSTLEVINENDFNPIIEVVDEDIYFIVDENYENKCVKIALGDFLSEKNTLITPIVTCFDFSAISKNFKMFLQCRVDTMEDYLKYFVFKSQTILNVMERFLEGKIDIDYYVNEGIVGGEMCEVAYVFVDQDPEAETTDVNGGFLIEIDELGITKITPYADGFN